VQALAANPFVPEPSAALLAAFGGIAVVGGRARCRRLR
jgi:hypothetical protein